MGERVNQARRYTSQAAQEQTEDTKADTESEEQEAMVPIGEQIDSRNYIDGRTRETFEMVH